MSVLPKTDIEHLLKGTTSKEHSTSLHLLLPKLEQLEVKDTHQVPWSYPALANASGPAIDEIGGITRSGRCYTSEELEQRRLSSAKASGKSVVPLTEKETAEILRVVKKSEYSVVEKLKKSPAHIDILTLLLSLDTHRDALMATLRGTQVPKDISPDTLQNMVGLIMAPNSITFSDDEIPTEGMGHTKALHIAVKTRGIIVTQVLIDNGSKDRDE